MAFEWLSGKYQSRPLEEIIEELGEPIIAKALGQVSPPGQSSPPGQQARVWCLLLLTDTSFVILHNESSSWMARLTGKRSGGDSVVTIPLASIADMAVPPRRKWSARLIHGLTYIATLTFRDGSDPIDIETDDTARDFFAAVTAKVG